MIAATMRGICAIPIRTAAFPTWPLAATALIADDRCWFTMVNPPPKKTNRGLTADAVKRCFRRTQLGISLANTIRGGRDKNVAFAAFRNSQIGFAVL